jgi:drug/metabolite transporter (DMT)-like permease
LVLLSTIWGAAFTFIKIGVADIPPLTLACARIVLATALLYGYLRLSGRTVSFSGRLWVSFFLIGFFGDALPFYLIGWGEVRIDSGLAAVLMALAPLVTLVLAHFFTTDDHLTKEKLAGVVVGLCGVALLFGPETFGQIGADIWRQTAVAAGAVCYAIASVIARRLPPISPVESSFAALLCASIQLLPFSLLLDQPWDLAPSFASLVALAYLGVMATALATIIYFHLIEAQGAVFLSYINYLIPVVGVAIGVAFLGESLSMMEAGALVLILSGIAIARPRRKAI